MSDFFPQHTITMRIEEPKAFRRFSRSLVEMALITGVLIRVFRSLALTHGPGGWIYVWGMMTRALLYRGLILTVWSLLLAGIVQLVRNRGLIKEEADDPVELPG